MRLLRTPPNVSLTMLARFVRRSDGTLAPGWKKPACCEGGVIARSSAQLFATDVDEGATPTSERDEMEDVNCALGGDDARGGGDEARGGGGGDDARGGRDSASAENGDDGRAGVASPVASIE